MKFAWLLLNQFVYQFVCVRRASHRLQWTEPRRAAREALRRARLQTHYDACVRRSDPPSGWVPRWNSEGRPAL